MGDNDPKAQRQIQPLGAMDPRAVGLYTLTGRLGIGGMGVVYLAQAQDGRNVALKVVRSEVADQPQFRARFAREVDAARSVSGEYTARLVDADTQASPQWIATEYVPGPTLAEHVEANGAMPDEQVRLLGLGLAEAIEAIHAAGLIHRDLKPSNIILSADGPKVIDFGISQAIDATSLTQTGVYVGSLAWMSPEQVTGEDLTEATDLFSLGLLLAYAASGQHPYGEGRPEAVAFRMVNQTPDFGELPPSLQSLIGRLLAKSPSNRPTPEAVISALTEGPTQINDITRVMSLAWDATVAGQPSTVPPAPQGIHSVTAPKKRRRGLAVALAGTTTLAAATAAAVALGAFPLPMGSQASDASAATPNPTTEAKPTESTETSPEAISTDASSDTLDRYPLLVDSTLTVRSGPYVDAEAIGQLSASDTVVIECTATGDPVQESDSTVNDQWNRITEPVTGWVSDAFVDTGATPDPQDACADVPTREESTPPNDNAAWPDLGSGIDYPSATTNEAGWDAPPGFPTEVEGYKLSYEESVTSRAFEGSYRAVYDVPSTMNGCANRRYYVRWRSLAEDYTIEAIWTAGPPDLNDNPIYLQEGGNAQGNSGWMSGWGCQVPAFSLIDSPGPGNLTDVVVEFQVWEPAV